jgi:hypothetical protein
MGRAVVRGITRTHEGLDVHALSHRLAAGAAIVAGATIATPAAAQYGSGPGFGIFGGLAVPTGDLGDAFESGYALGMHVGIRPESSPIGIRFAGTFTRFDAKPSLAPNGHANMLSFTLNGTYSLIHDPERIRPYLLGGVGAYNMKFSLGGATDSRSRFGLNGGGGVELPLSGFAAFAQAQFHYVFDVEDTKTTFLPIVVGIRF